MRSSDMDGVRTGRDAWQRRVTLSAQRPFLHFEGQTWTYGEIDDQARRYAGALAGLGVGLGTRLMVGLSNRPETMILMVATLQLGAVAVPLQGGLTFSELAFQIEHCEASILVADESVADVVLPRIAELPSIRTVVADTSVAAGGPTAALRSLADGPPLPWVHLAGHDEFSPALILYTSGSTGRPKGVVLPAGSFPSAGEAFDDRFGFGPDDNYFLPLTMSHALGIVTAPGMTIMAGASLTLADRFSPSQFWSQIAQSGATASILFPAHLNLLMETEEHGPAAGGSTLRLVITHAWIERFRARFGAELALVWGMTETGALCTGSEPGQRSEREGFVGAPMAGVQVQIRADDGRTVGTGTIGEICLRHPHAMLGYLKDPEATNAALVDGWVLSGDLGALDDQGSLYYLGRKKNMIKRSGENISAEEVENAFAALPGVSECLAFGVPDAIRAEEVALVVVASASTDPAGLLAQAAQRLVRWKLPRYLALGEKPLPRLGNGKLDRETVRRDFQTDAAYDRERT
jgi:acyl-CoA synthetase (AMP-forming)/AMP-acid ligase II